ncbi:ROK family transcriptional regulator [Cognatishimia sp. F0-27]|uniref:ROK family transcriptional regulator n=1 Tax=Cognatishimia sp. F0-27 TaxID=2816855 RepID=UPI001D0C6760|nr:ROK family transcriptional regulator [Cognatishimia sp. F0-27]MCC1494415.1 ROK family transcriptional regulator [Cognatishimia sp. F0-27]
MTNRQAVLGHIKSQGAMGRAQLARALGLSTQAISNIIAELTAEGLLVETGTQVSGRGLPAVQYGVNPKGGYALGVEVRPAAVFTALLDLSGEPVITRRRALDDPTPSAVLGIVGTMRDAMLAKTGVDPGLLMGAGVVMPGPFGQTGLAGHSADLPGWQTVAPEVLFETALGLPIELSNDANAAAMAERIGGVARAVHSYAYLYFGTGLGLGLVSAGQLVTGAFGNAGEIGHIPVTTKTGPAPLESCLSRVSVQAHLAASGRHAPDVAALDALHRAGDAALRDWIAEAAAALGQALHIIENLFDPQTVILGGAMPAALLDDLIAATTPPAGSVSARDDNPLPRLMRGASGRMTATIGAASLILNRAYSPRAAAL